MDFKTTTSMVYNATSFDPYVPYMHEAGDRLGISYFFKANTPVDVFCTLPDLIDKIVNIVGKPLVKMLPFRMVTVLEFDNVLITVPAVKPYLEKVRRTASLDFWGEMRYVEELVHKFQKALPFKKSNSIDWYYLADKKIRSTSVNLTHNHVSHDEFFPWIETGVEAFQKAYLESSENILLLIGEPGCGKTSFVRDFIRRHNLSAAVTYDHELMKTDQFFIEFVEGVDDLLIVEDADVILRDRSSGNQVMDKLLNTSDGLIATKKKLIFTANLTHLDEVDEALIRPGRCFEALVFRELNTQEAQKAAKVAGLPEPDGPKTLAKLFSEGPSTKPVSRLGFG